jgi:hypothetical protein
MGCSLVLKKIFKNQAKMDQKTRKDLISNRYKLLQFHQQMFCLYFQPS